MKLNEVPVHDEVWQEITDSWESKEDALDCMVGIVAGLYESYRGGPFGVCQRTVRDLERQLFHAAQQAEERWGILR